MHAGLDPVETARLHAASYRVTAFRLAAWFEENVPEGLAVFTLPEHHRKPLRTHPGLRPFRAETRHRRVS